MRPRSLHRLAGFALAVTLLGVAGASGGAEPEEFVRLGAGGYWTTPRIGPDGADPLPPRAPFRRDAAAHEAVATNQWYSSLAYAREPHPLHALPLTALATAVGVELGLPQKSIVEAPAGRREVRYPHTAALTVAPASFALNGPYLTSHGDWSVGFGYTGAEGARFDVTLLHGSPYAYFEVSRGDVRISFPEGAEPLAATDPRVQAFTIGGRAYAVFAPTGARFDWLRRTVLIVHLPPGRGYLSVAGLPDVPPGERARLLADYALHAYAFPTDTRATPAYDERRGLVTTTYRVTTSVREGHEAATLMALYPHQWHALPHAPAVRYGYDTVRGHLRVVATNEFTTEQRYAGFVPSWPALTDPAHHARLAALLGTGLAEAERAYDAEDGGTYWSGKALGATTQLLAIAEAEGDAPVRAELLAHAKARLEHWLDGAHAGYFLKDEATGTFVGYPEEYRSVTRMNDHHFHYGYWIGAAAQVALREPGWAATDEWGAMVGELVRDIATDERHRPDYPYLRNFDPYEGHSWASGDAMLEDGNNQESSSEAVNAWASLILWAEATGDRRLRDLGVYLYTTEIASVRTYWFDERHEVLDPAFGPPFASLVFGGKYAYATWWTLEPRQITGINLVPLTPASTYLGHDPATVRAVLGSVPAAVRDYRARGLSDGTPPDVWGDILTGYQALADADAALAALDPSGSVEFGETRAHTLYWILCLAELGRPDPTVTADATLAAVFRNAAGRRTHVAYNAAATPREVRFSDGVTLTVAPRALARSP